MLLVDVIFGSICIWPSIELLSGPSVGVVLVLFFISIFLLVVILAAHHVRGGSFKIGRKPPVPSLLIRIHFRRLSRA